jgi:tRNA dimethylallyltransferase
MYEQEVLRFLEHYYAKKNICILAGGSGLYINAVCEGIDEFPSIDMKIRKKWQNLYKEKGLEFLQTYLQEIDPLHFKDVDIENPKRLLKAIEIFEMTGKPYSSFLKKEKKQRFFRVVKLGLNTDRSIIYSKINERVDHMINNGLLDEARSLYPYKNLTPLNTVGYKELFHSFEGKISIEEAQEQIKNHSRAYARRQLTWLRRDKYIKWFEPKDINSIKEFVKQSINEKSEI